MARATATPVLPFTDNPEANALLGADPLALLIGFALDQQITVQHAFNGPWELRRRIGHLDPARIAAMDPAELERVFRERPALHRYPASMATRVAALCRVITETYGGDASRVWRDAQDGADLEKRLRALPSIGDLKVLRDHGNPVQALRGGPPRTGRATADLAHPGGRGHARGAGGVPGQEARPQGRHAGRGRHQIGRFRPIRAPPGAEKGGRTWALAGLPSPSYPAA